VSGYCVDCGELYELDALDLDLRCADCVKQSALDKQEREDTGKLYSTAYGLVSAEELNKIEREVNY
jgi:hypothetical protein